MIKHFKKLMTDFYVSNLSLQQEQVILISVDCNIKIIELYNVRGKGNILKHA